MSTDAYRDRIEALLLKLRSDDPTRMPFHDLIRALGCPGMRYYGGRWNVDMPPAPPAQSTDIVADALSTATQWYLERPHRSYEDTLSLLTGLASGGRWRYCIETLDSSYNLTNLLVEFSLIQAAHAPVMTPGPLALYVNAAPLANALFNEWLRPEVPFAQAPNTDVLLRTMFGDAWCDLFIDDQTPTIEITQLIQMQRPPFQPGLVVGQAPSTSIALPEMEQP